MSLTFESPSSPLYADSHFFMFQISEDNPQPTQNIPEINLETIETDSENSSVESSDSDSDSEESENEITFSDNEEKINIDEIKEIEKSNYPDWFMDRYRKSEFPTLFMDLLSFRNCFYMPQVENVFNMQTLQISLPILRAIAKILLGDRDENYFIYYARNDYGRVKRYNVEFSELELPKLGDIEKLDTESKLQILLKVLGIDKNEFEKISQFPSKWQLLMLSLLFWVKNSILPTVNICHIYAILFCIINLEVVDNKIGFYRLKTLFHNKYSTKLNVLLENKKNLSHESQIFSDLNLCMSKIDKNDCILFVNSFISYFAIDDKLVSNFKAFNIHVVDAFAQFQNCLYYTKHLNALFLFPLPDCNIADFFNGTFIYNLYTNFASRNDVDVYIDLLLKNCPTINDLFKSCVSVLKSLVDLKMSDGLIKKKRRRKRKKEGLNEDENEKEVEERSDNQDINSDNEIDYNNKFSLLRLVE